MKRRELKILGLSYSQSQIGSYIIVLSDKKGKRKLPLVIKPVEAQRIALELEGIKSPRPLTHDLFKSVGDSFGIDLQEIYIYSLVEGIFYTKLILSNGVEEIEVEATAGDALALSVIYKCPIFVKLDILESAGVYMEDDGSSIEGEDFEEDVDDLDDKEGIMLIDDLEQMMNDAISNEEYEIAAELRDKIQKMKSEK